jgi:hypothetical protein
MAQWQRLTEAHNMYRPSFLIRVMLKAALLFVLLNVLFALVNPLPLLGRATVYGWLVPPRLRLPYGENPALSYNLSLNSLDAMFASHEVSQPKATDDYRILVLGDSGTWGFRLDADDTLAAQINSGNHTIVDGRRIRAYNLGYPEMSLTKDVLLLDYAMRYQPDLILWLITLESFAPERQLTPMIVRANPELLRRLASEFDLNIENAEFVEPSFLDRTLVGRRRDLADWLRLQLYGFTWAATGVDQYIPVEYDLRTSDFEDDLTWQSFPTPVEFGTEDIAFGALQAGIARAGDVPVLIVNEPMFISSGRNSDLRYNFFYPRWAYDRYRELLADMADARGWRYLDLWNAISPDEFTDSPVHMTPDGVRQALDDIMPVLLATANSR